MPPRAYLTTRFLNHAGSGVARLVAAGNGWPSTIKVKRGNSWQPVDLYISLISSHSRKEYEYRFQNPAGGEQSRINPRPGVTPLLLGYTEDWGRPVCVAAEVDRRIGSDHRFSVLFVEGLIQQAAKVGWSEYPSTSDEVITAFHPSLLPAYLTLDDSETEIPVEEVVTAVTDAGFNETDDEVVRKRATKAVQRVARDATFRKKVVTAYQGECALCGLNWDLIQAAHIYPVTAPESPDAVWNGMGLCGNHHILFDSHKIFIRPNSLEIILKPDLIGKATQVGKKFLASTYQQVSVPKVSQQRPRPKMLEKRYDWFKGAYEWVS